MCVYVLGVGLHWIETLCNDLLEILTTQSRPAFIMLWVRHQVQAESKAVMSHLIGGYQGAG